MASRRPAAIDCDANSERFACDVSGGPNMLAAALHKIRDVVTTVKTRVETTTRVMDIPVECEWAVPAPPNGGMLDKKRVNVRVSTPGLKTPVDFGQVDSAAACVKGLALLQPRLAHAPDRLPADLHDAQGDAGGQGQHPARLRDRHVALTAPASWCTAQKRFGRTVAPTSMGPYSPAPMGNAGTVAARSATVANWDWTEGA